MTSSLYGAFYALYYKIWHTDNDGEDELMGEIWYSLGILSIFIVCACETLLAESVIPRLFNDGGSPMNFHWVKKLLLFLILVILMFYVQLVFFLVGPYGRKLEKPMLSTGSLHKFSMDTVALCVVIFLRYHFDGICHCLAWIAFVAEFQVIYKLAKAPHDLVFSDVLVGAITRLLAVYQKETVHDFAMGKFVLCMAVIYYRHLPIVLPPNTIYNYLKESVEKEELKHAKTTDKLIECMVGAYKNSYLRLDKDSS